MLQDGVTSVRGAGALPNALLNGIYPDGQAPAVAPQRDSISHPRTSLHGNQPALTDGHLQDLQPRGASAHVHLAGGSVGPPHVQDLQTRGAVTSVHLTGLGGSASGAQGLTMPAWTPTLAPMQCAGPAVGPSAGTSQVDGFQGSFGGDEDEHSQRGSGGDNADPAQAEEDESERQNKRKYAPFAAPRSFAHTARLHFVRTLLADHTSGVLLHTSHELTEACVSVCMHHYSVRRISAHEPTVAASTPSLRTPARVYVLLGGIYHLCRIRKVTLTTRTLTIRTSTLSMTTSGATWEEPCRALTVCRAQQGQGRPDAGARAAEDPEPGTGAGAPVGDHRSQSHQLSLHPEHRPAAAAAEQP